MVEFINSTEEKEDDKRPGGRKKANKREKSKGSRTRSQGKTKKSDGKTKKL